MRPQHLLPLHKHCDGMIEVDHYSKTYGATRAVRDLSFRIAPGEILGLIGPNGAGKTTTIRAITGIIQPTSGRLRIGGFDVADDPISAKKLLAYIPDDPKLFDLLTVREHLQFMAVVHGLTDEELQEREARLFEQFDLAEHQNKPAMELSRGMKQKVAICCAYLYEPKAILFDEPLTGLDPKAIRTLKDSIRQQAEQGTAVLISSHLLSIVEDLCSNVLILQSGERRFLGTLDELRATHPAENSLEDVFFRITEVAPDITPHLSASAEAVPAEADRVVDR